MTKYKTEYKTVSSETTQIFDKQITKHLSEGYTLYGNPYFSQGKFCQAMLLHTNQEPEILND